MPTLLKNNEPNYFLLVYRQKVLNGQKLSESFYSQPVIDLFFLSQSIQPFWQVSIKFVFGSFCQGINECQLSPGSLMLFRTKKDVYSQK